MAVIVITLVFFVGVLGLGLVALLFDKILWPLWERVRGDETPKREEEPR